MADYGVELAKIALEIQAIKLQPENPFTWASGYRMPIYNDNRLLLGNYEHRKLVADGLVHLVKTNGLKCDVIAGVASGAVPAATFLANELKMPLVYIAKQSKEHGLGKRVEGVMKKGQKLLLVEDLISTGKSSVSALQAARDEGAVLDTCVSIFTYEMKEAVEAFQQAGTKVYSLLTYTQLVKVAKDVGYITEADSKILEEWCGDPTGWGAKHGFPKVEK